MARLLLVVVVISLTAGCSRGGVDAGSTPPTSGSAQWKLNRLNQYAYTHCYALAKRAATAQPFGSGPPIYSLSRGYPQVAIGHVKPRGSAEMHAVDQGCATGMVQAFADVRSPKTRLICRMQAQYVPVDLAPCEATS